MFNEIITYRNFKRTIMSKAEEKINEISKLMMIEVFY